MKQIDRGVGFSELASFISETWGCTRRNARHVVSLAHKEWMEIAFGAEELDQRDLLFQSVARLERTARKAEEAGQFAVVVGCVAQQQFQGGRYQRSPFFSFQTLRGFMVSRPCNT